MESGGPFNSEIYPSEGGRLKNGPGKFLNYRLLGHALSDFSKVW